MTHSIRNRHCACALPGRISAVRYIVSILFVLVASNASAAEGEPLYEVVDSTLYVTRDHAESWQNVGELPALVRDTGQFEVHPDNPEHFFLGTDEWLWFSTDGGESWTQAPGALEEDPEEAVNFVPDLLFVNQGGTTRMYFTAVLRGLYVSDDNGLTSDRVAHDFDYPGTLVAASTDANVVYLIGDQGELYQSLDGGESWATLDRPEAFFQTWSLAVHPDASHHVLVGGRTNESEGVIFVSEDNGATWTRTLGPDANKGITGIVFDPKDTRRVYAVSRSAPSYGMESEWPLHVSDDGGMTWQPMENVPKASGLRLHVSNTDDALVLFAAQGIWRSENGGASWSEANINFEGDEEPGSGNDSGTGTDDDAGDDEVDGSEPDSGAARNGGGAVLLLLMMLSGLGLRRRA